MNNQVKFSVIFLSITFLAISSVSVYAAEDKMEKEMMDEKMKDDKMMKDSTMKGDSMDDSMKDKMMSGHMKSPLKQTRAGVEPHKVQCREGHQLVFKKADWSPACVKASSVERIIAMGWAADHDATLGMMEGKMSMEKEMMEDEKMMKEKESMMMSVGGIDISMAAPVEGSPDAPITIIQFGDFQCPKCDQWFLNEKPTVTKDLLETGKAKFYFLDFTFLGDDSVAAAQAAYCAGDQDMYNEYHSILYSNQGAINGGWASQDALMDFASEMGLDRELFDECLSTGKYADRVSHNTEVGASVGVKGTPTFFIVGTDDSTKRIDGPQPSSIFESTVNDLM